MDILDHNTQLLEKWSEGVMTRIRMSILAGGRQLCIFDQSCEAGSGAPLHVHTVEEVLEGTAEVQLGKARAILTTNQSVLIPAGVKHRFRNPDQTILHVRATLAVPSSKPPMTKNELSRRWVPDSTGQ